MSPVLDVTSPSADSQEPKTVVAQISIPLGSGSPQRSWRWVWAKDCLVTLAVAVCLLGIHEYIEQRPFGRDLKNFEIATLHRWLSADTAAARAFTSVDPSLPIVIDISPTGRTGDEPTSRDMLAELVNTLQEMHASAIGLDIDFSPTGDGGFVTTGDPKLFDQWVQQGNVRIGVFRRLGLSPEHWLGHPGFRTLAAGMMLPKDATLAFMYNSPDRRDVKAQSLATPETGDCVGDYLLQMPAALYAIQHRVALCDQMRHASRIVRSNDLTDGDGRMVHGQYVIDYSLVNQIQQVPYRQKGDLALWRDAIEGRAVFIGDLDDKSDVHRVPGRYDPLPGVLIHASAFATLNSGLLWHVSKTENWLLDGTVLAAVFALSLVMHRRNRFRTRVDAYASTILFYGTVAALVLVLSMVFIRTARVFWPDFIWIVLALLLHPYARHVASMLSRRVSGYVSSTVLSPSDAH